MGRVQTKAEDLQPALGLITVRRPDAYVSKLPVLIDVKGFFGPEPLAAAGWDSARYWRL